MRLLNIWTGEFEWHNDLSKVRYAILSHVWRTAEEGGEQSYDDVCRIQAAAKAAQKSLPRFCPVDWPKLSHRDDTSPSDDLYTPIADGVSVMFSAESPLSNKIKALCKVAREAGFDLVWNDTCCIDKSSSAELLEAINSMYEWYRLSDMCYVYLADVPDGDIPQDRGSRFRESRWHTRGWTLQELIAPERIEFLTSSWRLLGTKLGLAFTLYGITRINVNILLGRAPVNSASVAQRMSWTAKRETTRIEDRAYSLMGLFGVHLSPIYGEGTNAFLRLQEEVITTIPDQSIFSWSGTAYDGIFGDGYDTRLSSCLLASSPESFAYSDTRPIAPTEFGSRLNLQGPEEVPPLDCTFAPQGVRIRLLCVDLTVVRQRIPSLRQGHHSCVARRGSNREADRLALLQCEDSNGGVVGLTFHSSDVAWGGLGSLVGEGRCVCSGNINRSTRIQRLSQEELAAILEVAKPEMTEVSLLRYSSDPPPSKILLPIDSLPALDLWPGCDSPDSLATFDLSPDSISALLTLGFAVSPLKTTRKRRKITLRTTLAWRDGVLLHYIPLRIYIEDDTPNGSNGARFCLSAAPLRSHGLASNPTSTSCLATGSEVPGSDCKKIQDADWYTVIRRYTVVQFDLLIHPYPQRPQWARLLRLSLQRTPQGCQPSVFLIMAMSEESDYLAEASTPDLAGDSAKSPSPSNVPAVRSKPSDATKTRWRALEERVDALGRENSALHAQVSTATSQHAEMKSEVAALAGQNATLAIQNTAITSQNAALASQNTMLVSQMAAMSQRLDALAAAAGKSSIASISFTFSH